MSSVLLEILDEGMHTRVKMAVALICDDCHVKGTMYGSLDFHKRNT